VAIVFPIVTSYNDKGTKKADAAFTSLAKKFAAAFSVTKVVQFGKASLEAFSEDEQAAARLSQSVKNLGLAFEDTRISKFISDLELTSGVLDDSLRPAMQALLNTTGSVAKSQELMALALDMSRASGFDVATVSKDLSKAFVGQTRSLSKYKTGLSQVELTTKSFGELQEILQTQFKGQSAAYLDTYAGKVSLLNVAYANMQETIGKGLVDAFATLSGDKGIDGGITAMDAFADSVADTTRGVANLVNAFQDLGTYASTAFDLLRSIEVTNVAGSVFQFVKDFGKIKPAPFREPMTISAASDRQAQIDRDRAKAEAAAAKREKELLALTKKQVKAQQELNKKKKEEGILGEISKRFEMDRIQIAAALGGQINDVERLRLELMQAILDEDVKRAIILEGQLIKAESAAKELALLLDSLDTMVGDPFADWPGTITRIQELLKQLKIKIPIETLFAEKGLRLDQEKMTVTKLERMDVNANNVYINGLNFKRPLDELENDYEPGTLKHAIREGLRADLAESDAAALLGESEALLALIESERALAEAENAIRAAELAALFAKLGLDSEGNPMSTTTINVNVEGNVTSAEDLAETITDIQYTYQRTGKGLLFSSIAI
jgi:hypothetical protein